MDAVGFTSARVRSRWGGLVLAVLVALVPSPVHAQLRTPAPHPVTCTATRMAWSCTEEGGLWVAGCERWRCFVRQVSETYFYTVATSLPPGDLGFGSDGWVLPDAPFERVLPALAGLLNAATATTDAEFGARATEPPLDLVVPVLQHLTAADAVTTIEALALLARFAPGEYARVTRELRRVSYRPGVCGGPAVALACTGEELDRAAVFERRPGDLGALWVASTLAHEARHHRTEHGVHRIVEAHDLVRDDRLRHRLAACEALDRLRQVRVARPTPAAQDARTNVARGARW